MTQDDSTAGGMIRRRIASTGLLLLLLGCNVGPRAGSDAAAVESVSLGLRLPAVIGSGMVLQRDTEVSLWGWSDPGREVTVEAGWSGATARASCDPSGRFEVRLATGAAGGPHRLTFRAGEERVIEDVLLGEVWICSGQSNMEMTVAATASWYPGVDGFEKELEAARHPRIRLFNVKNTISMRPNDDCEGSWAACAPDSVRDFSAVAYFFGRRLHQELGVPIGLIGTNWGGTVAESWTSRETLETLGDFDEQLARIDTMAANPATLEEENEKRLAGWRRSIDEMDQAAAAGWTDPGHDPDGWAEIPVPGVWEQEEIKGFDGIIRVRTSVDLPEAWAGRALRLELGPIDDMDVTWFNGEQVGAHMLPGKWQTPRVYEVPAGLVKAGRNVIAVRVLDTGGAAGLAGKAEALRLSPADGADSDSIGLAGEWLYQRGSAMSELPRAPQLQSFHQNWPTALFNGMIAPLVPFGIRGAIWYQGESNRNRAAQYRTLFPAMIEDWRSQFGRDGFPFYFVQIAPYRYNGDRGQTALLREAQMMTLRTPNTGMAVTMDIGNPKDIHPTNKQDVGYRLALWALARTYGQDGLVHSGPLYRGMERNGNEVRISFDHVGGGLVSRGGGELSHFTLAGMDRVFHPATALIDGETVRVTSSAVADPVAVRFAFGDADEPNLSNREGLPAAPFRSDDWPLE